MSQNQRPSTSDVVTLLAQGDIAVEGQIPWSSNYTFFVKVSSAADELAAVYKPQRGEQPLHDFPAGLQIRERATFVLSESLDWSVVPETVVRKNAPLGEGSLQRAIVDADQNENYFNFREEDELLDQLRKITVFDLLANNADRKAGHILRDAENHLWAIDNSLCFHAQDKLRTVMWDFTDEELPAQLKKDVRNWIDRVPNELGELLSSLEYDALLTRANALVESTNFPSPDSDWRFPWPLV